MSCDKTIMQGDDYAISFTITDENDQLLNIEEIQTIQFVVGDFTKYYHSGGSGEVTYLENEEIFSFPITQEESFQMSGEQECQIRIKFTSGRIVGKVIGELDIQLSKTKEAI